MEKDCFAYVSPRKCKALTNNSDCGIGCPFYKSKMDLQVALRKVDRRLASLPTECQLHIAGKYYGGECPWLTASKGIRK